MVRNLFNFILLLVLMTSISFARAHNEDAKIQAEYGKDLTHVPFFLKFDYKTRYHKDWKSTFYSDRKYFLLDYERTVAEEKARAKAEAKAEADKERERIRAKKEEIRRQKARLKAEQDEEKAEAAEDKARQDALNSQVKAQQQEIQQMRQEMGR